MPRGQRSSKKVEVKKVDPNRPVAPESPGSPEKEPSKKESGAFSFDSYVNKNLSYAKPKMVNLPSIQTGCDTLDMVIPGGGIPRRVFTEIFGKESAGKTTLVIQMMVEAKKLFLKEAEEQRKPKPKTILFLDYEHIMDYYYAATLGVEFYDPETGKGDPMFRVLHPTTVEEAHRLMAQASSEVGLLIIDSVATMQVEDELLKGVDFKQTQLKATKLTAFFLSLTKWTRQYDMTVLCINQMRVKADGRGGFEDGSYGGWNFKHSMALRIGLMPGKRMTMKVTDSVTGLRVDRVFCEVVHAEIYKNKRGSKGIKTDIYLRYGHGFDNITPIVTILQEQKLISVDKQGYLSLMDPDDKNVELLKARGVDQFISKVKKDEALLAKMYKMVPYGERILSIRAGEVTPPSIHDFWDAKEQREQLGEVVEQEDDTEYED